MINFGGPSCVLIQETKLRFPGTFKLDGYQIFEKTRSGLGGGLLTAIDESLSPVLISSGPEDIEILVVQISIGTHKIRILNGYGPQESENKGKIYTFWQEIEKEIIDAKEEGCFVLIQMDANAKLGAGVIKGDSNSMSDNGHRLWDIIQRHNLKCLNSHALCEGTITRHRKTVHGDEKAILDYIIVCDELAAYFQRMLIDEKRENILTKYVTLKGVRVKSESDHNPLYAEFNLTFSRAKTVTRREIFDFKNAESLKTFSELTENCDKLRKCFTGSHSPKAATDKFFKVINETFHKSFKKIRIRTKNTFPISRRDKNEENFLLKADLEKVVKDSKSKTECEAAKHKLEQIEFEIYEKIAESNAKIVTEQLGCLDTLDGKFCQLGMWKIKKKICPRPKDPPTAKKDAFGNLITSHTALKNLYLQTYINRLEHRKMKEKYQNIMDLKTELWDLRLESLKKKEAVLWTLEDLEEATKSLKNNQARDPNGMLNELFKPNVAGKDLKIALVGLMNLVQIFLFLPEYMEVADITSIFKNKGSRMELSSERGIFILGVLRKILDKLLYLDKYQDLENHMSDSNIGARKKKNVRNHLFIVYGVITSVLREGRGCVDIQIYDLVQAFDSLWLQDCMNDIYDCLPENQRDRKLALIYETNINNLVAVNTPVGQTGRVNMPKIVQQGGGWGPMECSVSIDKLGRICTQRRDYVYKYKDKVNIIALAMVDDLLGIAPCGLESLAMNTFINVQIEMKKLRFHTPGPDGKTKCHKIHVGKKHEFCPTLLVHGTTMPAVSSDTYLGDIICGDGSNKLNIENRVLKGLGKVAQIMSMVEKISLGKHFFKIAFLLRESIFLSSVLTNSEVWYRLTTTDLEELEILDRSLLKRILAVPNSTPTAALYLETGCMSIGTIVKARRVNYLQYLVKLPKDEMLSKFFHCQWLDGKAHDWTEHVKNDLEDFNLPVDLDIIQKKSVLSWKNLVKREAKKFELERLLKMKESKSESKMKNLKYEKLEAQKYLTMLDVNLAKTVFRFRVRMAQFSGNYKGQGPPELCPLCGLHKDLQELCFYCPSVLNKIELNEEYENLFQPEVSKDLARNLIEIEKLRKKEE